jgi:glycosyltransferase involved in cell wall biosynthesis
VGDGPLRPELEALAGRLGVFSYVTLHGAVAHDRLPAYYRAADVAVLSSRFESQSMVALEAAACGRATVGTAVGVLPELVGEGLTVRIGDQHALAAAVVALACDKTRRTRLGERCAHIASSRYALATTVHQLTTLYTHLLEETARYPATSVAAASRGPRP